MSELSSQFNRQDVETLIESVGDWETVGNQEFHFMQMIRNAPLPPEDHEAFQAMEQIKDYYTKREKKINDGRALRQEKAVFLKAKLMLVRQDMQIDDLFEMPIDSSVPDPALAPAPAPASASDPASDPVATPPESPQVGRSLELAEFFIKDMGVWEYYEKFLADRESEESEGNSEEKSE